MYHSPTMPRVEPKEWPGITNQGLADLMLQSHHEQRAAFHAGDYLLGAALLAEQRRLADLLS